MRKLALAFGLVALLPAIAGREAVADIITFDELPTQALNGVSLKGVTFGFTIGGVASTDATFDTLVGPGGIAPFITPPNAEGNSLGTLTLSFARAVSSIQFGLARNVPTGTPGAEVQLFSGGTSLGTSPVSVTIPVGGTFPEGLFTSSATNVTSAIITFDNPTAAPRFAMDNLSFTPVPEPSSFALCGAGGLVLAALIRRRGRR